MYLVSVNTLTTAVPRCLQQGHSGRTTKTTTNKQTLIPEWPSTDSLVDPTAEAKTADCIIGEMGC